MVCNVRTLTVMLFSLLLLSCQDKELNVPRVEEIQNKYVGTYCTKTAELDLKTKYRLELKMDSVYKCYKTAMVMRMPQRSICRGQYLFEWSEEYGTWNIVFNKGKLKRSGDVICEGKILLWSRENGYETGENETTLPALQDDQPVVKDACEI